MFITILFFIVIVLFVVALVHVWYKNKYNKPLLSDKVLKVLTPMNLLILTFIIVILAAFLS